MLYLPRAGRPRHLRFRDLPELLRAGDLMVVNNTRVIPARIRFVLDGRSAEILLLHPLGGDDWECLARPGRRMRPGVQLVLPRGLRAEIIRAHPDGRRTLRFSPRGRLAAVLEAIGEAPLPPYIRERASDPRRYQTVYARVPGSAAAPTAGLHFDRATLRALHDRGVTTRSLTLRIGLDTFQPIREVDTERHRMHSEWFRVPPRTWTDVTRTRAAAGRVVAVGTTSVRALESAAAGQLEGNTELFITPGFRFRATDLLLTNFHLPRSTLLLLVCAFGGKERVLDAYREAVREGYRFYSFGDAMLIEPPQVGRGEK